MNTKINILKNPNIRIENRIPVLKQAGDHGYVAKKIKLCKKNASIFPFAITFGKKYYK